MKSRPHRRFAGVGRLMIGGCPDHGGGATQRTAGRPEYSDESWKGGVVRGGGNPTKEWEAIDRQDILSGLVPVA